MKQFDIEVFQEAGTHAHGGDRWQVLARDWTFPEDAETWQQSAQRALEVAAPTLNLGSGLYRVIEFDPDRTFPIDKAHELILTTRTEYDAQPAPGRARLEDVPDVLDEVAEAPEDILP